MRILWLSPWLRPRARVWAEHLKTLGVDVMLVTSDLHFESDVARDYETVLLGRPVPTADWIRCASTYRKAAQFKPDLVVTELLRDPRWRLFTGLAPRVRIVHDDKPHDPTHIDRWWNRRFLGGSPWDIKADATIVFCNAVAESLRESGAVRPPLYVASLTSDLDPALAPPFVDPQSRRNFLLIGRQRPYKNHDVVFSAWEAHTKSPDWRGDELVMLGGGEISAPLPPHARWNRGSYQYREVVSELASAKGSLIHSRSASQSGVQVLSLSLGVPTLVSTAGGLPEYQPPGFSVTGIDDVEGLARDLNRLADPAEVERQSKTAVTYYQDHFAPPVASKRLAEIFQDILRNRRGR
jgi:glycosyltransferase involved in cell wall biosynthesis